MASTKGTMNKARATEVLLSIVGAVCAVGLIGSIGGAASEPAAAGKAALIIMGIIFAVLTVYLFFLASKHKKMRETFRQYINILNRNPDGRLDTLARNTGSNTAAVIRNLEWMIKKGMFHNAYIDRDQQRLIISRDDPGRIQDADNNTYVTVTCPSCGGLNKIAKGKDCDCTFCGTSLRA